MVVEIIHKVIVLPISCEHCKKPVTKTEDGWADESGNTVCYKETREFTGVQPAADELEWVSYPHEVETDPESNPVVHVQCPYCETIDEIYELDRAIRANTLQELVHLPDGTIHAFASTGDGDYEHYGWQCMGCMRHVDANIITIDDWV